MPAFTIRDVSEVAAHAIRERAAAAGKATEAYIREWIETSAQQPVIKARYTLKAIGPDATHAHIRREFDSIVGRGLANASEAQANAYKQAVRLVELNGPGDRERAIALLVAQFEDVFETA